MDLNLLRVFLAVYEARSLTVAAESLYVTQSAVSQALARMRRELGDTMFYRSGREMLPTPYATEIYPLVRDALDHLESAIATSPGFDPARSTHRFRIALSELGELSFLPHMVAILRAEAPRVAIEVVPLDSKRLAEWLTSGIVDLAISSSPMVGDFERSTIRVETYAALMAPDHPLAKVKLTLARYLDAQHVVVAGDSGRPNIDAALDRVARVPTPHLRVDYFSTLPLILPGSPYLATVPMSLAEEWAATHPLVIRTLPFHLEPVNVRLLLRASTRDTAPLRWLAGIVEAAAAEANRRLALHRDRRARGAAAGS